MNADTNNQPGDSDLGWQATCYLLDEMEPHEREAYELLLAENQDAREALAETVELLTATASLRTLTRPAAVPGPIHSRTHSAWIVVLAISIGGMLLGGRWYLDYYRAARKHSGTDKRDDSELARQWSETRLPESDASLDDSTWIEPLEGPGESPSWIIAGVIADANSRQPPDHEEL